MSEFILRGGTIVDGTGAVPFTGDVFVSDGRVAGIARSGEIPRGAGEERVATGLVVAPGFVDIHTHSDLTRLAYPDAATRVVQGITTEVIGNCGLSPAPVTGDLESFREIISVIDIEPSVDFGWITPTGYLEAAEAHPGATNVVPLIGHGGLRYEQSLLDGGKASLEAIDGMRRRLHEALDAGYWGMSLGLMYAPGESSGREELVALAKVLGIRSALMAAHLRDYDAAGLESALEEVLAVAGQGGAALEVSHLRSIRDPDGSALSRAITLLESTTVDVEADSYPYLAGHTTLLQMLPPRIREQGIGAIVRIADEKPGYLASAMRAGSHVDPDLVLVARGGEGVAIEAGHSFSELLRDSDEGDAAELAESLIRRYRGKIDVIVIGTRPEDALLALAHPLVSVASDGMSLALDHSANVPHPRSIGTFPRAFSELSEAGMPLAQIVHKMTAKPARRLGLDRGELKTGAVADIVVFEPAEMRDQADYACPLVPPSGVHDVYVSGVAVLRDGTATGARPGTVLRRTR